MKATHKTLSFLLDELNLHRTKAGLCPLFFIREVHNLKLQNRYTYQLYMLPKDGASKLKALASPNTTNELRLYLAGTLDGIEIGMKIAAK